MIEADAIVIGAGPAGLAFSATAAAQGIGVLMLDEQAQPGGQIWRGAGQSRLHGAGVLDADYWQGLAAIEAAGGAGIRRVQCAKAWHLSPSLEVCFSHGGQQHAARGKVLVIAAGARERPVAVPGWTLPGAMTAGAAQILLKTGCMTVRRPVFAGSGPLLYLAASQYLAAGADVAAVVDTTPLANYWRALPKLPATALHRQLRKGLRLLARLRRSGVVLHQGATALRLCGTGDADDAGVTRIEWRTRGGQQRSQACDAVFLHQGLVPNAELALAVGCDWEWSRQRLAWEIATDTWGESSVGNVFVVGDSARVAGAEAAAAAGALAACRIAERLGRQIDPREPRRYEQVRRKETRLREFLEALYAADAQASVSAQPGTIVCRCENLSVGDLAPHAAASGGDLNHIKSGSRCAMGPCQGRMCAHSAAVLADRAAPLVRPLPLRPRMPLAPLSLGELASMADI